MIAIVSTTVSTLIMVATIVFALLGPMILAKSRNTKIAPHWVLLMTVLTLPTVVGWAVILAYSLFGETKET